MLSSRWFQTFTAAKEDRDWKEGRKSFPEKKKYWITDERRLRCQELMRVNWGTVHFALVGSANISLGTYCFLATDKATIFCGTFVLYLNRIEKVYLRTLIN